MDCAQGIRFIQDDSIVYLDPGSTCLQLAKLLRLKKNITVLTNSLPIGDIICDSGLELIMAGGKLQKKGRAFIGYYTTNVIDSIRIDIAFLGCDGFQDNGWTDDILYGTCGNQPPYSSPIQKKYFAL